MQPTDQNSATIYDAADRRWLRFANPLKILVARSTDEVLPIISEVEKATEKEGLYAAGWISYEAAPAFDPSLETFHPTMFPLVWFGIYKTPERVEAPLSRDATQFSTLQWRKSIEEAGYKSAIKDIKEYIARGDTYQVNFTYRLHASPFQADPWELFTRLIDSQNASYNAYIDTEDWTVCSASPELFFQRHGDHITTRPMKGTAPRGTTLANDKRQALALKSSEKERAENIMITDMVRNDLGRVAEAGTVRTDRIFDVDKYPTLWQMTSTVEATSRCALASLLQATFPPASITGAPKCRTMQIIKELETEPRNIYTGCVGFAGPDRRAQFNVAIRTALVDKLAQRVEYGVGGGIVWDSKEDSELAETNTKALILNQKPPEFRLLETILRTSGSDCYLLDRHLSRIQDSAEYFDFQIDPKALEETVTKNARDLPPGPHKLRVLLASNGETSIESTRLPEQSTPLPRRLKIAKSPINPSNPFLYHKTTNRKVYVDAKLPNCDDVILWNPDLQITETTIANLVLDLDGRLYTPPVDCGLLAGTLRAELLDQGTIAERRIWISELDKCRKIYVANSVRGLQPACLV